MKTPDLSCKSSGVSESHRCCASAPSQGLHDSHHMSGHSAVLVLTWLHRLGDLQHARSHVTRTHDTVPRKCPDTTRTVIAVAWHTNNGSPHCIGKARHVSCTPPNPIVYDYPGYSCTTLLAGATGPRAMSSAHVCALSSQPPPQSLVGRALAPRSAASRRHTPLRAG